MCNKWRAMRGLLLTERAHQRAILISFAAATFSLLLGGCSNFSASDAQEISSTLPYSGDTAGPIPDYRKIIADSLAADPEISEALGPGLPFRDRHYSTTRLFLDPRAMAPFEVSNLRRIQTQIG